MDFCRSFVKEGLIGNALRVAVAMLIDESFHSSLSYVGEMPYSKVPRSLLFYGLGTMGFHFGDFMT